MTKQELIDAIWGTATVRSKKDAAQIIGLVTQKVLDELKTDGTCNLPGLGRFKVTYYGERPGRNPQTGESLTVAPSARITFRASHELQVPLNAEAVAIASK